MVTADRILEIDQRDIVKPIVVPTADGVPYYMELSKKNAAQHATFLLKMKHAQSKEEERVQLRLLRNRPRIGGKRALIRGGSPQGVALWQWLAMVNPYSTVKDVCEFDSEDHEVVSTFIIRFFYNLKRILMSGSSITHFDLSDFAFSQSCLEDINVSDNPFTSIEKTFKGLYFPKLRNLHLPDGCTIPSELLECMPALKILTVGTATYSAARLTAFREQLAKGDATSCIIS